MKASLAIDADAPATATRKNQRSMHENTQRKIKMGWSLTCRQPLVSSLVPARELLHRLQSPEMHGMRRARTEDDGRHAPPQRSHALC